MALTILFVALWAAQAVIQWYDYAARQAALGRDAGASGYLLEFWATTLAVWQSAVLTLCLLATWLVRRNSPRAQEWAV